MCAIISETQKVIIEKFLCAFLPSSSTEKKDSEDLHLDEQQQHIRTKVTSGSKVSLLPFSIFIKLSDGRQQQRW
jgi:hypothetical protein